MRIAVYKDTPQNARGADIAVRQLAEGLSGRGHSVTLFEKREFSKKIHGNYEVIVSTGTNEILDFAQIKGLPPIVQQFHTDPAYPFRQWIKKWRHNRAIKAAISAPRISVIGNWSSFGTIKQSQIAGLRKLMTDAAYRDRLGSVCCAYCDNHYRCDIILGKRGLLSHVVSENEKRFLLLEDCRA